RVDGWNSSSTHRSAAAMSAHDAPGVMRASAAAPASSSLLIGYSSLSIVQTPVENPTIPRPSHPSEHRDRVDERKAESPPEARAHEPEPGKMNEGAAEQRNEQPVAPGRLQAENADPLRPAGGHDLPRRHRTENQEDDEEERRRLPGPCHPGQAHRPL